MPCNARTVKIDTSWLSQTKVDSMYQVFELLFLIDVSISNNYTNCTKNNHNMYFSGELGLVVWEEDVACEGPAYSALVLLQYGVQPLRTLSC